MEKVKILELYEYIRNETPEEFEWSLQSYGEL